MNVNKKLQRYIIPNIFAMIGLSCYILADTFFISLAAGTSGITALNLALPVYSLIFGFGSMIGMGFATMFMLEKSKGHELSEKMFSHAVEWELLISLFFVFLGIICPDAVLRLMGADNVILETGTIYLKIALLFAPCFMLNYTFTDFVRNDGSPKIAMAATLSSSFFNILFDYIFMFPLGMGINGAALATGLSPVVSMAVCMIHFLSTHNTIKFRLVVPKIRYMINACRMGTSYFIGEVASGLTTTAFNYILLGLSGNIAVAAYGVIANFALVATAIFNGIAQGQQPILSELYAKNNITEVTKAKKYSMRIAFIIAIILIVCVFIFAEELINNFNSESSKALADFATSGIRIYFMGFIFASANIVNSGYFSAVNSPGKSFIIAISRGVLAIVVFAFILSRIWGVTGVWLSFPVAELFTYVLGIYLGKTGK